jgi:hypothetical protein
VGADETLSVVGAMDGTSDGFLVPLGHLAGLFVGIDAVIGEVVGYSIGAEVPSGNGEGSGVGESSMLPTCVGSTEGLSELPPVGADDGLSVLLPMDGANVGCFVPLGHL